MNTARLTRCIAGCLALASLTACSSTGGYQSDRYRVPDGSEVELMQTLEFPGRSARSYIQFGEPVRRNDVNEWEPYCSFGLNRKRDDQPLAREVTPTVFTVRKTHIGVDVAWSSEEPEPGTRGGGRPIQVAGLSGGGGRDASGTPSLYFYYTRMELYSDRQPQVDDLTCTFRGSPVDRNLTVDDIRDTLGGVVRIN